MKRVGLFLALFILMIPIAMSLPPLNINIEKVRTNIFHDDTAIYKLSIRDPYNYPVTIYLSFPDVGWVGYTEPLSDYTFQLAPNETKEVRVLLSPKPSITTGPYSVKVRVKEKTNDRIYDVGLPVYVKSDNPPTSQFLPSLRIKLESPYNIDPREPWIVNVTLENLNRRNITNLSVRLYSDLFNDTFNVNVGGNRKKVISREYTLDKYLSPREGIVRLYAIYYGGNRSFQWEDAQYYNIISYHDIKKNVKSEKYFLKYVTKYELKNNGNVKDKVEVRVPITNFEKFFTTYSIEPLVVDSAQGKYYLWSFEIEPKKSVNFDYSIDYKPLFYLFLIIILIIVLYYVLRSPMVVSKDVVRLATKEGGISSIKIIIHIKNRSNRSFEDIKIMDKIPHLVEVEKDFEVGTIEPVNIAKNTKTGTLVKWEFSHLDPYEERIITYKIKSQMGILGGLSLPSSVVKFHDKKGREMIVKSNRLNLEI